MFVTCDASSCLLCASAPVRLKHQVDVRLVRCVLLFLALLVWELGAWGPIGDWRFQVTLFLGPSILQAPGERFPLGGFHFQGCHGYPGGTPYNGLYGEAPPEMGAFFGVQVCLRVEISLVEVYKRVGKSVI